MNCRFCGTALPEGALFCGECGRPVPAAATASSTPSGPRKRAAMPPVVSSVAFSSPPDGEPEPRRVAIAEAALSCPQCGAPIAPDEVFCGECGFVLGGATLPIVVDPDAVRPEPEEPEPEEPEAVEELAPGEPEPPVMEPVFEAVVAPVEPAVEETPVDESAIEQTEIVDAEVVEPEPDDEEAADDAVVDPVVTFFGPTRRAMPPVFAAPAVEPEAVVEPEPIPLVEPRPPAVEPYAPQPAAVLEVAAAPAPKPLRAVPDPFPWGKSPDAAPIDLEATRAVASTLAEERFVLQFSTGESVTVSGAGLVGRNPSSQPGEFVDQLVAIFDAGKSVSKTHLEFGQDSGRFWVSDRYSTNGSTVRQPDAEPKRCDPGRRYFIARGTRVDIGEQFFVVS